MLRSTAHKRHVLYVHRFTGRVLCAEVFALLDCIVHTTGIMWQDLGGSNISVNAASLRTKGLRELWRCICENGRRRRALGFRLGDEFCRLSGNRGG